jgi:hypothetical protein
LAGDKTAVSVETQLGLELFFASDGRVLRPRGPLRSDDWFNSAINQPLRASIEFEKTTLASRDHHGESCFERTGD